MKLGEGQLQPRHEKYISSPYFSLLIKLQKKRPKGRESKSKINKQVLYSFCTCIAISGQVFREKTDLSQQNHCFLDIAPACMWRSLDRQCLHCCYRVRYSRSLLCLSSLVGPLFPCLETKPRPWVLAWHFSNNCNPSSGPFENSNINK